MRSYLLSQLFTNYLRATSRNAVNGKRLFSLSSLLDNTPKVNINIGTIGHIDHGKVGNFKILTIFHNLLNN